MIKLFFSILIIMLQFSVLQAQDFSKILERDYTTAIEYLESNKDKIYNEIKNNGADPEIVIPVIFPELVRYSIFKNFFETAALELIYIDFGKEYADFSIGKFQMKPSFIEKLEYYLMKYEINATYWNESLKLSEKEIRKLRIKRLKSEKWQIEYISAFYLIVDKRFCDIEWKSKAKKIQFFATAFNHGFECSEEEIREWIPKKCFPNGANQGGKQYAYSNISLYFYNDAYHQIFD